MSNTKVATHQVHVLLIHTTQGIQPLSHEAQLLHQRQAQQLAEISTSNTTKKGQMQPQTTALQVSRTSIPTLIMQRIRTLSMFGTIGLLTSRSFEEALAAENVAFQVSPEYATCELGQLGAAFADPKLLYCG